jgi:hypothetical protein
VNLDYGFLGERVMMGVRESMKGGGKGLKWEFSGGGSKENSSRRGGLSSAAGQS